MTTPSKYILVYLTTALALIALHGFLSWKGFDIYGEGESLLGYESKIAFRNDGKFTKTARVSMRDFNPEGYLIGSSRLRDGLDPKTANELTGKQFFNYGMSGLVIKEMKPVVDHILANKAPEIIIIGLDFFSFNDTTKPAKDMVLKSHIAPKDYLKMYLSSFSLKSAKSMMDLKGEYKNLICYKNGFCNDERFTPEEVAHYIALGLDNTAEEGSPLYDYRSFDESLALFNTMLNELKQRNVQVHFFFSPAHILYFSKIKQKNLLPAYLDWKEKVSQSILTHGYDLWDFDIKSEATNQKFIGSSDYFSDDIHYTKKFGDIILTTVLTGKHDDYSVKITGESLAEILRQNREVYPNLTSQNY